MWIFRIEMRLNKEISPILQYIYVLNFIHTYLMAISLRDAVFQCDALHFSFATFPPKFNYETGILLPKLF